MVLAVRVSYKRCILRAAIASNISMKAFKLTGRTTLAESWFAEETPCRPWYYFIQFSSFLFPLNLHWIAFVVATWRCCLLAVFLHVLQNANFSYHCHSEKSWTSSVVDLIRIGSCGHTFCLSCRFLSFYSQPFPLQIYNQCLQNQVSGDLVTSKVSRWAYYLFYKF